MFSNPLPDNEDYRVLVSDFARRHFLKRFAKDYKGKRWPVTQDSIFQDLKRVHAMQSSQQVDELKRGPGCVLFKYDFAVAQSGISPKASGNRCLVFLEAETHVQTILLIYGKGDLPKNQHETQWFMKIAQAEFPNLWSRFE